MKPEELATVYTYERVSPERRKEVKVGFIFRDPKLGGTSLEEVYTAISSHIQEQKGIECENIYINNKRFYLAL